MSSLHRFFFPDHTLQIGQTIDLGLILHQLQVVLRLQSGTQVVLLDGAGRAFLVELLSLTRKEAIGRILVELSPPSEPTAHVTLYQCTLKADKFEWVLQKATELGVSCFVPVISQRSIVRPAAALLKKYERWRAIIREAAEQCGRGRLPKLADPLDWDNAIHHAQGVRIFPWEEQHTTSTSIREALVAAPSDMLPHLQSIVPNFPLFSLLVGPEGGIAGEEAAAAQAVGWQAVSLGPRILRAETAALTSIVLAMEHLNQL